ncbi:MAG: hypothetical protein ACR2QU_10645 [Gammaproteobacteria bacterium]
MTDKSSQNGSGAGNTEPLDSVVSRAVELGYKVIEEQIRQGQQIAGQVASGNVDPSVINGNVSEIGDRVLRFYSDMGALWFEMIESVLRNPAMGEMFSNFVPGGDQVNGSAHNGAGRAAANGRSNIPVEIVSREPTGARVSVELGGGCDFESMVAQPLCTRDADSRPIDGVHFTPPRDGWPPSIRVTIPEGQAPGTYSGLILSAITDEPVGTLCVHIPPPSTEA